MMVCVVFCGRRPQLTRARATRHAHTLYSLPLFPFLCSRFLLQCPASEVESWVVRAITSGLIDARIDQPAQQVVVGRSTQRVFDAAAWKGLQATLSQWKGAVSQLLRSTEDALAASR